MASYFLTLAVQFIGVFAGMALFFLPFLGVFAYRNREQIKAKRPHFNYFMERFFISPESNALIFCWAVAEATVWYIIPEFLLFLMIFMKIHRKFDLVKYDLLGTVVGTIVAVSWRLPDHVFRHLPFIRPKMLGQVDQWYDKGGVLGLAHQPFSGVPYKVFAHEYHQYHFFILWFIIVAIIARMIRYVVVYEATKALYPLLHRFVRRHYAILFVVACLMFTLLLNRVVRIYT